MSLPPPRPSSGLSTAPSTCSVFTDDRHRVKLHPMLGDPSADYINANYIDVSALPLSLLLAWPCPLLADCPGRTETCQGGSDS